MPPRDEDLAFRALYDAVAPELYGRLHRGFGYTVRGGERRFLRVHSRFVRDEVVQETFTRYLEQRARGTFDAQREAAPYIHRIGYFTALRYAGRLSREIPVEEVTFDEDASTVEDAAEQLLRKERAEQVQAAVGTLEEKDRRVYELTYSEGLSQSSVASELGLSRDQVYRTLVGIRSRVLEHIKGLGW